MNDSTLFVPLDSIPDPDVLQIDSIDCVSKSIDYIDESIEYVDDSLVCVDDSIDPHEESLDRAHNDSIIVFADTKVEVNVSEKRVAPLIEPILLMKKTTCLILVVNTYTH